MRALHHAEPAYACICTGSSWLRSLSLKCHQNQRLSAASVGLAGQQPVTGIKLAGPSFHNYFLALINCSFRRRILRFYTHHNDFQRVEAADVQKLLLVTGGRSRPQNHVLDSEQRTSCSRFSVLECQPPSKSRCLMSSMKDSSDFNVQLAYQPYHAQVISRP